VSQHNLVNEADPDGDSSYIQSNSVNDINRFTYPAVNGSSVLAVVAWANARKDDGGTQTIQASIKSGSATGTSGTGVALGTNYQYQMLHHSARRQRGIVWNQDHKLGKAPFSTELDFYHQPYVDLACCGVPRQYQR
jgi:hypothetical protein